MSVVVMGSLSRMDPYTTRGPGAKREGGTTRRLCDLAARPRLTVEQMRPD
jgi:hypothetical protein